jgi:hypothetical protein
MDKFYRLLQVILAAILLSGCEIMVMDLADRVYLSYPASRGAIQGFESETAIKSNDLVSIQTIAILEIPEPPNYGRDTGYAPENAEYGGLSFGNTAQAFLKNYLEENGFEVIEYSPNRENGHRLIDDYTSLDIKGADAYLDVVPIEVEYRFLWEKTGPHVSTAFRLVSADSNEEIYAGSIQYGWKHLRTPAAGVKIESPEDHEYESSEVLKANKKEAVEWLVQGIEAVSLSIGKNIIDGKLISIAANEIDTATYDQNLWKEALFEAECIETKGRAIYIEERAKQLFSEDLSSTSSLNKNNQLVPVKPTSTDSIIGTYISEITTNSNQVFNRKKHRQLKINFEQVGNCIFGTNGSAILKITGVRKGDNISFFTWPSDISIDKIKGKWKINSDGTRLTGKWNHPNGVGKWNLTRIE